MSISEPTQARDAQTSHEPSKHRRRWWRWILGAVVAILMVSTLVFVVWALNTPDPGVTAASYLVSSDSVAVTHDDGYVFTPSQDAVVGFIFYQGARVDPGSYAQVLHSLAAEGYLVVAPDLRLNMAILEPNAALGIMDDYPDIDRWVVGGHSLGGAMAAQFTNGHRSDVDGVVLWAAYPAGGVDLSDLAAPVASISASLDGLATPSDIEESRPRLPSDTDWVVIEGGNHAQFGDYGTQSGDNPAEISGADQARQIIEATSDLLNEVATSAG